ncbi:MAG: hypothetical protein NDI61_12905, partial [Bdellovibrionaceae bacterium]|nr:hypothetical protein [Pseudobdellovibrionaceae bacterium]
MCRTLAIILLLLLGALPGGLAHAVNTNPHSCVDIFGHGQSVHAQAAAPSLPSGQAQSGPKTTAPSPRTAKNASPSTTDKVKDAVHSTIDAIKRFFGFKKPSRDPKDPQEALQKESQSTRERGSSSQEGQGQPGGPGEPGDGASTSSQQQQGSQGQAKQAQSQPSPQSQLLEQNDSQYQVTNKDVTNQVKDGKNTPNYAIGTTADVPMSRLRESIYENLGTPLRKMPHLRTPEPPSQPSSKVSPQASKSFLINEQGARTLVIGKPYGKRPVLAQYQDFRVRASTPGEYVVESLNSNPLPKDIYFWLENEPPEVLNPQQIFELTRKSAIAQQQWPTHIHDGIQYARKNGGQDPRKVAQSLSRWFQKDGGYVYYTDPNASGPDGSAAPASKEQIPMDPLGLAQAKTFNCDGGAQLGAILLRDFFNLPTRVVDGRPIAGSKVINNERYNVANINVPRHAWVEVWMNNEWVPFDFTPAQDNPENEPQKDQLDPAEDPTENDDSNDDENADKSGQEQDQDTDSDDDSSSDTSDQPRSSDKKSSRDGKSSKLKSESEANSDSASDPKSKESESNPRQQSKKSDGSKKQERSKDESQSDQKKDAQKFPSKAEQKTTPNKPQTQNKSNPQPSNPNSKDS